MLAHPPRPPLLERLPPLVRELLTWCVVAAFTLLQFAALLSGSGDTNPRALPLAGAAVAMALPLAWIRRRPLPVLAVVLASRSPYWKDCGRPPCGRTLSSLGSWR